MRVGVFFVFVFRFPKDFDGTTTIKGFDCCLSGSLDTYPFLTVVSTQMVSFTSMLALAGTGLVCYFSIAENIIGGRHQEEILNSHTLCSSAFCFL